MTDRLSPERIEAIATGQEQAPPGWRNLTYEKQLEYCDRRLEQEISMIDPGAVVRVERAARDAQGGPIFDKNGMVQVIAETTMARDHARANSHWVALRKQTEDAYRRSLARSNEQQAKDGKDLQRALDDEFGPPQDRSGLRDEIEAFARRYRREHGHVEV